MTIRIPIEPQPPSQEDIVKLSGSNYGWMECADYGEPGTFRPVGPVWAVRQFMNGSLRLHAPHQPGDRLPVRERVTAEQIRKEGTCKGNHKSLGYWKLLCGCMKHPEGVTVERIDGHWYWVKPGQVVESVGVECVEGDWEWVIEVREEN